MNPGLFQAPDDAGFVQVVGRHLHLDAVTGGEADPAFAHFAGDGGEDEVLVVEFDAEHGPGQNGIHYTFDFDMLFFHVILMLMTGSGRREHLAKQPERGAGMGRETSKGGVGRRYQGAVPQCPRCLRLRVVLGISNGRDGRRRVRPGHRRRNRARRLRHRRSALPAAGQC